MATTTTKTQSAVDPAEEDVYNNPFKTLGRMTLTEAVQETYEHHKKALGAGKPSLQQPKMPKKLIKTAKRSKRHERFEKTPWYLVVAGYVSYALLFLIGHVREAIWGFGPIGCGEDNPIKEKNREGYVPLFASFEAFFLRNIFRRQSDCFNRPIFSVPGATVDVAQKVSEDYGWTFKEIDESRKKTCINMVSYNYLGYAENEGPCTEAAIESIKENGLTRSSVVNEVGRSSIQGKLEETVAKFLGKEDAITMGMGFATNSLNIPQIIGKNSLVISDERNHASLILGLKLSGATVKIFKHNSMDGLEKQIRKGIVEGHPKTGRPFKKVFIVVEGIYSMEGSIVRLPEVVALKKKYGAYIYLDEAHSVGAMGPNGRGVVDYFGLNPADIDIMMGTFTKSFGSAGGYIAGSKDFIAHLRAKNQGMNYATAMSAPVCAQIIASMNDIMDKDNGDGLRRIKQLARNSRYFRQKLQKMGMIVYGHDDSPVVPVMLFVQAKITGFVHGLFKKNIATIGVGYPATDIAEERTRFCVSASHTKEMLDKVIDAIQELSDQDLHICYSRKKKYVNAEIIY